MNLLVNWNLNVINDINYNTFYNSKALKGILQISNIQNHLTVVVLQNSRTKTNWITNDRKEHMTAAQSGLIVFKLNLHMWSHSHSPLLSSHCSYQHKKAVVITCHWGSGCQFKASSLRGILCLCWSLFQVSVNTWINSLHRNMCHVSRGQLHAVNHIYHGPIICSTLLRPSFLLNRNKHRYRSITSLI